MAVDSAFGIATAAAQKKPTLEETYKVRRDMGATDQEIAEAVAQAGLTRHWSAILNGMQIDFEALKVEFGSD